MDQVKLLFRVDGTYRLGTGNVQRCLVLARHLEKCGFNIYFITKYKLSFGLIQQAGFYVIKCKSQKQILESIVDLQPRVIIIDSPQEITLSAKIREKLKSKLYFIGMDISARYQPYFDIVVSLSYLKYNDSGEKQTDRYLSGLEHMIIAPEYRQLSHKFKVKTLAKRILACFGGSDSQGFSQAVIDAFADEKTYEIELVVGPGYRDLDKLQNRMKAYPNLHLTVNCQNMGERMLRSDIGIFCFGTLAFEAACIGLPMLVVAPSKLHLEVEQVVRKKYADVCWQMLGDRQHLSPQILRQAALDLVADPAKRSALSQCGQNIVDGRGAERICRIINERVGR